MTSLMRLAESSTKLQTASTSSLRKMEFLHCFTSTFGNAKQSAMSTPMKTWKATKQMIACKRSLTMMTMSSVKSRRRSSSTLRTKTKRMAVTVLKRRILLTMTSKMSEISLMRSTTRSLMAKQWTLFDLVAAQDFAQMAMT